MKRIRLSCAAFFSVLLVMALCQGAFAAGEGTRLADFFLKKVPAPALDPSPTLDQAMRIQAEYNESTRAGFRKDCRYKAGLTNPSVQKVFGVNAPLRGTLMEKMILKSGATVDGRLRARPLYEGD